jgi:hypothetical protein
MPESLGSIDSKRPMIVHPGEALKQWSFVPYVKFKARNGEQYSSALALLAELAIEERWHFGKKADPKNAFRYSIAI